MCSSPFSYACVHLLLTIDSITYSNSNSKISLHLIRILTAHFINSSSFNPIALKKAKTVYNFGLFECNRVKTDTLAWNGSKLDALFSKSGYVLFAHADA